MSPPNEHDTLPAIIKAHQFEFPAMSYSCARISREHHDFEVNVIQTQPNTRQPQKSVSMLIAWVKQAEYSLKLTGFEQQK